MEELNKIKAEILRYTFEWLKRCAEGEDEALKGKALDSLGTLAQEIAMNK